MLTSWKNRRFTNVARYVLDEWLPPVLRDNRLLFHALGRAFHGPNFDLDFKRSAHAMTEEEFAGAYASIAAGKKVRYRLTDMTEAELAWMTANAVGPEVLEIGCGHGVLAERLAHRDLRVTATDFSATDVEVVQERLARAGLAVTTAVAHAEHLPFPDKSFDTVLCAHTLEHVRKFETAVSEMIRVARKRILVIVPCQRYYRYTVDYHLHFFPEPEQLVLRIGLPNATCEKVTGDLCYRADFPDLPAPTTGERDKP